MAYVELWEIVCMLLTRLTAEILLSKPEELRKIKWNVGEANTDNEFSILACRCCEQAWVSVIEVYPEYSGLTIVCKTPDINIEIYEGPKEVAEGKIELKSGKHKIIPGSTIQTRDVNEPVIYCLRNKSDHHIRYGQYHQFMLIKDTALFQDRSPRPHINFDMLTDVKTPLSYVRKEKIDWIPHYAKAALTRANSPEFTYWQDDMIRLIIKNFVKQTSVEEFARLKSESGSSSGTPPESVPPSAQ
jgi:hypothetical protein